MKTKRETAALVVSLLAALLIASCGGSTDGTMSKAEFVERGDEICARAESEKNAALEKALSEESRAASAKQREEALVTEVALPPIDRMTLELAELGEPAVGAPQARAMVAAFEAGVAKLKRDPSSALKGADPFEKAGSLAAQFGFEACSDI